MKRHQPRYDLLESSFIRESRATYRDMVLTARMTRDIWYRWGQMNRAYGAHRRMLQYSQQAAYATVELARRRGKEHGTASGI